VQFNASNTAGAKSPAFYKIMAKYFDKEKNKEIDVPLERWCWGVMYLPTPEAQAIARRETEERNKKIKEARNKAINEANKQGVLKLKKREIYDWYIKETAQPIRPFMNELHQFDSQDRFHRIGEVEQDRIYMASLYKVENGKMINDRRIDIPFRWGMKLIHKITMVRPAGEKVFKRVYCFGYKYDGREYLNYILPDDRIIMSPDQGVDLVELGA